MGLLSRVDTHSSRLQNHRALVVGGSGGIGRAVTYLLASHGASVVCHGGHDRDRMERVVKYVRDRGGLARGLFAPLHRAEDIVPHLDDLGRIDVLVVAMGPVSYASLAETTAGEWRRMVELNLLLPGILVSHVLPSMVEHGWGRIVLFGAPHGDTVRGFRTMAAYGAAKSGLAGLCKSAALQTYGRNVSVNMICPGYVDTEYLDEQERREARTRSPRGALIAPERVARMVHTLVTAEEPDVNGAVITMDQGLA